MEGYIMMLKGKLVNEGFFNMFILLDCVLERYDEKKMSKICYADQSSKLFLPVSFNIQTAYVSYCKMINVLDINITCL